MPNPTLRARVAPAIVARVKACVDAHNARLQPGAPEWDQGDLVRVCVLKALPDVEAELGIATAPPAAPAKRTAKKTAKRAK
jgi:hypothetical protein